MKTTLLETSACTFGLSLSDQLRWSIPFIVFKSALTNGLSILDDSVEHTLLRDRITRLFPYTSYHEWNSDVHTLLQRSLLFPDNFFDRILLSGTLDGLNDEQAYSLLRVTQHKLKRRGAIVLTSSKPLWIRNLIALLRESRDFLEFSWKNISEFEDLATGQWGGIIWKGRVPATTSPKRIVLAMLTWNTCSDSLESVRIYAQEASMLMRLGNASSICICDNGSTDGTAEALKVLESSLEVPSHFIFNQRNRGISVGRNQIINYALSNNADYLLMTDSDIQIIPFSSYAFIRHLENSSNSLGSIGIEATCLSRDRISASPYLYNVEPQSLQISQNSIGYYGMFRMRLFREGIRYDETGPMGEPGWGFEDNDLAYQLKERGYFTQTVSGVKYYHGTPHISIKLLHNQGEPTEEISNRRKQYVVDKWANRNVDHADAIAFMSRFGAKEDQMTEIDN